MAFYDLKCQKCGHEFEVMQPMSAPNPPCNAWVTAPGSETEDGVGAGEVCGGETVKMPVQTNPPRGGDTPYFYPGRH